MYRYCKVWRSSAYAGNYLDEDDETRGRKKERKTERDRQIGREIQGLSRAKLIENKKREKNDVATDRKKQRLVGNETIAFT